MSNEDELVAAEAALASEVADLLVKCGQRRAFAEAAVSMWSTTQLDRQRTDLQAQLAAKQAKRSGKGRVAA